MERKKAVVQDDENGSYAGSGSEKKGVIIRSGTKKEAKYRYEDEFDDDEDGFDETGYDSGFSRLLYVSTGPTLGFENS